MASTISSGGRVCLRRDRIVGLKLLIRSGTVESEAMTWRQSGFPLLAKVSRMKRTCRRCFLAPGSRRLRSSALKMARTTEFTVTLGQDRHLKVGRVQDESDNTELASQDSLASERPLK